MNDHEIRVAVDIGSKKHHVAIGSSDGRVLEQFEITHDKAGFERFFGRICEREQATRLPVVVAIEGLSGWARPLDRMVQERGYELLNVNNVKLARFKEIFPGPAKTDRIDTRKILDLMHMRERTLGPRSPHGESNPGSGCKPTPSTRGTPPFVESLVSHLIQYVSVCG